MRALNALLTREAREQAWLVAALGLIGCVLVPAFHGADIVWSPFAWTIYKLGLVGCLTLAASGILITESFTRESENERGERLEILPLPVQRLALAKLLWIAAACGVLASVFLLACAVWTYAFGSVWEGETYPFSLYREKLPLELYAPLWLLWAVGISTLLRRWLLASTAVGGLVLGSILAWPWPLREPAVVPGWLILVLACAVPIPIALREARMGWRLPRENASAMIRAFCLCGATLGVTGFAQVQGQDWLRRPTARDAEYGFQWLSQDGRVLCVHAYSPFPTVGGGTQEAASSWLVDTTTGAVLQDGWPTTYYSRHMRGDVEEIYSTHQERKGKRLWSLDPQTGAETYLGPNLRWLWDKTRWRARSTKHGTLLVSDPLQDREVEIPWKGNYHMGQEPGLIYTLRDHKLTQHEVFDGRSRVLVQLPVVTGEHTRWDLNISPCGDILKVSIHQGQTRYLDAKSGALLATAPDGWWTEWTYGPRPFAVARPVERRDDGVQRYAGLDSLWISRAGPSNVRLPQEGSVLSSASERLFLHGSGAILELDQQGRVLNQLEIHQRAPGELAQ